MQCYLLGSDLEDILMVWIDSTAEPIAVSLSSSGPCVMDSPFTNMWNTNVIVKYPDSGPVPDTATYIQKLEREREARERGETKDNRSFLGKYVRFALPSYHDVRTWNSHLFSFLIFQWMYIVPALIFVLLTSATNPEGAGGGSGSGQRQ